MRERTLAGDLAIIAHTALLPARRLGARLLRALHGTTPIRIVAYGMAGLATVALVVSFAIQSGPLP